ncbi:MAG TPA: FKBP-type peptidyl-prolyl cis-trans isomerase [Saprospiraceae bacterium]|nr:FKBP-type peptidyl-prolyl cis-trans isomerase [Saprospiraceae bacterium]HMX89614.1 FKBP-type peptidyl-prolyl cis-trans isomerase [Saprospiraceae bacterium]HMZ41068.1 FKBP-type peptidyl-prolyl cis-trans isomerase [Saprospiraceae bacterium]HNA65907.1 FKBP-type peptidyl-prolyl cis-trans isomerase [Saprospiraceae bacterium]HNB31498.1 FKBP-type peptidyl-prolyl cis-trans isomerase [Saprospiraceae bacterium]
MDTFSYSLGMLFAKSLHDQGIDNLSYDDLVNGMKDMMNNSAQYSLEQASANYNNSLQQVKMKAHASTKEEGEKFLAANKTRQGVITTPSGLQYEVIKIGDGPKPKGTDKVKVHYHGTLTNGKVFDSSVERGEPISFPLNNVIPGWTEGVQLMPVGSKFKFFIPYNLAYGDRGAGADIKPFSALIFEVELLDIEK